jgi:hypothetical protein
MSLFNKIKKLPNELIDKIYLYTDFITIFEQSILLKNKNWLLKKIFITKELIVCEGCGCPNHNWGNGIKYKVPVEKIFNVNYNDDNYNNKIINKITSHANNHKYLKEMLLYIKDNSDIKVDHVLSDKIEILKEEKSELLKHKISEKNTLKKNEEKSELLKHKISEKNTLKKNKKSVKKPDSWKRWNKKK